jgi:Ser/Thr protein kinase RdoA (MazF antagonist)
VIGADDAEPIAAAFGLGDVIDFAGPWSRGELGQVWRLSTDAGTWAVKESLALDAPTEHTATTEFNEAAIAKGVPAPAVRRGLDGAVSVSIAGTPVRVFGWVELDPPDPSLDAALVGSTLATMHRVDFDSKLPAHPWFWTPVGPRGWDGLIADLAAARSPLADRVARWRGEFVANEEWLTSPRAALICHRDLWADNLRRTPAGAPCIIDWDNAGEADPNQELAMVLYEFSDGETAQALELAAAYADAGGPGRVVGRGDFSMTIAVLGHIAERIGRLWLAPGTDDAERARLERRFDEFDERPFTREVIERLLDAVTPL